MQLQSLAPHHQFQAKLLDAQDISSCYSLFNVYNDDLVTTPNRAYLVSATNDAKEKRIYIQHSSLVDHCFQMMQHTGVLLNRCQTKKKTGYPRAQYMS